jgi:acyl-homoserine lactone acylase PvdQ
MKTTRLVRTILAIALLSGAPSAADEAARWRQQAAGVTIGRDDWGIAHVHGRTDAEAVFGMIYAQAEDDFNRVEANYLTALGRTAEAEGEAKIWQDLRQRLFIDPEDLKAQYALAVTAGGESGDPASKHFNDEAERYAAGRLREVYFYPEQLAGHTERTYRPGESN